MRISSYSLGCKVNTYESEAVVLSFLKAGFELVNFNEEADVVIINTCSITEISDAKSRKIIRQATRISPQAIIAVMGCYSQLKAEEVKKILGVDIIIGTKYRDQLYDMIIENLKKRKPIVNISNNQAYTPYEELKVYRYTNRTRGFIKIEDGCDNFCSYCTIPYARGRVRSRIKDDVIEEVRQLTKNGAKELVLTGINTGSYGKDFPNYRLVNLLEDMISEVPNVGRIRLSSVEIMELSDELLDFLKSKQKYFCNHLHIPLQGGSDNTLTRMQRKYTLRTYQERIAYIRRLFPNINITTDIMVGFSGEAEEDFQQACQNVRELSFGEMHVFPYSRRPLTKAYDYPMIVADQLKQQRVKIMLALNEELALNYRKQFVGQSVEVLVEKCDNNIFYGHTSEYIAIEGRGDVVPNTLVKVKLLKAMYPVCQGEII